MADLPDVGHNPRLLGDAVAKICVLLDVRMGDKRDGGIETVALLNDTVQVRQRVHVLYLWETVRTYDS